MLPPSFKHHIFLPNLFLFFFKNYYTGSNVSSQAGIGLVSFDNQEQSLGGKEHVKLKVLSTWNILINTTLTLSH